MAARRACGLYRTTAPLPGDENAVPAGRLVHFHGHAGDAPHVVLPVAATHNTWRFATGGVVIRDDAWVETLERLLPEGFYVLSENLLFDGGWWPAGTLLQLGYTRQGEPTVFIAQRRTARADNDLFFSDAGVRIKREDTKKLAPVTVHRERGDGARDHG